MIEQAIEDYKTNFMTVKGVLGVCSSHYWTPTAKDIGPPDLHIYIQNLSIIDLLPQEFQGFKCQYFICPNGISPGCD